MANLLATVYGDPATAKAAIDELADGDFVAMATVPEGVHIKVLVVTKGAE